MKNDNQKKKIEKLKKRIFQLEQENDFLKQEILDFQNDNQILSIELAEARECANEYVDNLEKSIQEVKEIKSKYKKLILSTRKTKQNYSNEMKELLRNLKKEIE